MLAVIAAIAAAFVWGVRQRARREQFVREAAFPVVIFEKFAAKHPALGPKEQQLVARGLRQFFLSYLKSGGLRVAMPSKVVDDLWHEFILDTVRYRDFCDRAFGKFLHHSPAVKLGKVKADNEGLRRVWWFTCREENINPRKATRLPLLFALDRKLGIHGGFLYDFDARHELRKRVAGDPNTSSGCGGGCASGFSDKSIDGTTDGFGDGSGGGDGGCGGGCGGGD